MLSVTTLDPDAGLRPVASTGLLARGGRGHNIPSGVVVSDGAAGEPDLSMPLSAEHSGPFIALHGFEIDTAGQAAYGGSGGFACGRSLVAPFVGEHDRTLYVVDGMPGAVDLPADSLLGVSVSALALHAPDLVPVFRLDGLLSGTSLEFAGFSGDVALLSGRGEDGAATVSVVDLRDFRDLRLAGELITTARPFRLRAVTDQRLVAVGTEVGRGLALGPVVTVIETSEDGGLREVSRRLVGSRQDRLTSPLSRAVRVTAGGGVLVPLTSEDEQGFVGLVGLQFDPTWTDVEALGRITHEPPDGSPRSAYEASRAIHRSFVDGDTILTVSERGLGVNDATTLNEHAWVAFIRLDPGEP